MVSLPGMLLFTLQRKVLYIVYMPAGKEGPHVVLVDQNDRDIGTCSKLTAHVEGRLHRAISVFVFDTDDRLLLQRRATTKYHSPGLWTNTCCTHPHPGESPGAAAHRRLIEEMGFDCPLKASGSFIYRAVLTNGLVEHEYDQVFVGQFDGTPQPDPSEVAEWRRVGIEELLGDRDERSDAYTAWFWQALDKLIGDSVVIPTTD